MRPALATVKRRGDDPSFHPRWPSSPTPKASPLGVGPPEFVWYRSRPTGIRRPLGPRSSGHRSSFLIDGLVSGIEQPKETARLPALLLRMPEIPPRGRGSPAATPESRGAEQSADSGHRPDEPPAPGLNRPVPVVRSAPRRPAHVAISATIACGTMINGSADRHLLAFCWIGVAALNLVRMAFA